MSPPTATAKRAVPPVPPPKPKNYQLHGPPAPSSTFSNTKIGIVPGFPPPPADSDTDSGICADSDNQLSPRRNSQQTSSSLNSNSSNSSLTPTDLESPRGNVDKPNSYREYLTPNSARRLFEPTVARRLPQKQQITAGAPFTRSAKQHRVRFADELSSGSTASTSSTSSEQSIADHGNSSKSLNKNNLADNINNNNNSYSAYYFELKPSQPDESQPYFNQRYGDAAFRQERSNQRLNRCFDQYETNARGYDSGYGSARRDAVESFSVEDVESIPCPPSYALACSRIRQSRRDTGPPPAQRSYGTRSTSLPRGSAPNSRRDSVEVYPADVFASRYRPVEHHEPRHNRLLEMRDQLAKSMENLTSFSSPRGRRRLPTLPSGLGSCTNLSIGEHHRQLPVAPPLVHEVSNRQPAYSRQRRCRRGNTESAAVASRRSQSLGRASSAGRSSTAAVDYPESPAVYSPTMSRSQPSPAPVRAQLIALDHRGFRTVLIEKLQPGPFGFYIATGMLNQKRGIYISRVSIPSLVPVLSVGDEILYVDDELIKGRSLEYVQSLIAGKSGVVITLLPTVGRSGLC